MRSTIRGGTGWEGGHDGKGGLNVWWGRQNWGGHPIEVGILWKLK